MGSKRLVEKKLLRGLTDEQVSAVLHHKGPALVLAAPGSGKTRTLTHRIAHLVGVRRVKPEYILAVTFTNKASKEMAKRVASLIDDPGVVRELTICTFHSLCARILRQSSVRFGVPRRFTICDETDVKNYILQAASSVAGKEMTETALAETYKVDAKSLRGFISDAKQRLKTPEMVAEANEGDPFEISVYAKYTQILEKARSLDFDDLLFKVVHAVGKDPKLQQDFARIYNYVLVDEYQDTNHAQFSLAKYLSDRTKNLWVCGDPDQSIYRFRGADISNILLFEKHYQGARTYRLEANFRSQPAITAVANAIIKNNVDRPSKEIKPTKQPKSTDEVRCFDCVNDLHEASVVGNEIKSLLARGMSPSDFAILYRTKVQSRVFEEYCVKHNIPHRVVGSFGFYNRTVVKDIISYMKLKQNPRDDASFTRVYNRPLRRLGNVAFGKLCGKAEDEGISLYRAMRRRLYKGVVSNEAASGFEQLRTTIKAIRAVSDKSVAMVMDEVVQASGYERWLIEQTRSGTPSAKAKAAGQIEHLHELRIAVQQFDLEHGSGLTGFLEWVTLLQQDDHEGEEKKKKVLLMTCHASKGLEFSHVYVVGSTDTLFPCLRPYNSKGKVVSRAELARDVEEERRLFFVASTRAQDRLTYTWAFTGPQRGRPAQENIVSRFVEEAGELVKRIDLTQNKDSSYAYLPPRQAYRVDPGTSLRPAPAPRPASAPEQTTLDDIW